MATQTLANIAGFLKQFYVPPIREQLNNSSVLYYRAEKNEEDVAGEDLTARIPLFYKRNQGIGWRAVGGTLPTAGRRDYVKATVAMTYLYGKIRIAGQAIKASRNNNYAFAKVVDTEVRGMVEGLKIEVNRALYGDGSGAMGKDTDTVHTNAVLFSVDDASRFEEGMLVDSFTAKTAGTQHLSGATITAVDRRNDKIAVDLVGTEAQNDFIFRAGSRGLVMMGLEGAVDGADSQGNRLVSTFQGLTLSSNLWWDANVIDNNAVLQNLTLDRIQRGVELGEIMGQGRCSIILSEYDLRRKYVDLTIQDRRYVGSLTLDGGWSALEYSGGGEPIPWVVDYMALENRIFCLDERTYAIFRAADFDWMDLDGAVLRKVTDVDEYDADSYSYLNLGVYKRNCNTVIRDQQ